jgi:hypothetical protein
MKSQKFIIVLFLLLAGQFVMPAPQTHNITLKKILDMHNAIRANPPFYANRIQTIWKDHITGCVHTQWNFTMNECLVAVDEAIAHL